MKKFLKIIALISFLSVVMTSFAAVSGGYYTAKDAKVTNTLNKVALSSSSYPRTDITVVNYTDDMVYITAPVYQPVNPHGVEHVYNDDFMSRTHLVILSPAQRLIFDRSDICAHGVISVHGNYGFYNTEFMNAC